MRKTVSVFFGCLACFVLAGCGGGGDSNDDERAEVTAVFVDDDTVGLNEEIDLTVEFTFSREIVVDDNRNVAVLVSIPNGLTYVAGSARVEGVSQDNKDEPVVETCSDGDTFLSFDLGQSDLNDAEDPSGDADGKLVLALRAVNRTGPGTIEARADYDATAGSCASGIVPEESTLVQIG